MYNTCVQCLMGVRNVDDLCSRECTEKFILHINIYFRDGNIFEEFCIFIDNLWKIFLNLLFFHFSRRNWILSNIFFTGQFFFFFYINVYQQIGRKGCNSFYIFFSIVPKFLLKHLFYLLFKKCNILLNNCR